MVKIQVLSRSRESCTRERVGDHYAVMRNPDPIIHPFHNAIEYTRALNATKLERLFAKPFLAALEGHQDGVYAMAKDWRNLLYIASGSADGTIKRWNLSSKKCIWSQQAHNGPIKGISFIGNESNLLSCGGDDKTIKLWSLQDTNARSTFSGNNPFINVDGHRSGKIFASCGIDISLWDVERTEPIHVFSDSTMETNTICRFNQAEVSLLACAAYDRSITLFDTRIQSSLGKLILKMKTNSISWNPQEPMYFAVANEDHNSYVFDMRFLEKSVNVLKGHIGAVMDIDYSPTGREIVTAGYDRTLRIYNSRQGFSRDVYYNRRMQRLFCAKFTMDSKYVLSGSDDGVVRLWKAHASEKISIKSFKEQSADDYNKALKEKFRNMPEVNRISRHRRIPKEISNQARTERIQRESKKKKIENIIKNSKPGTVERENIKKDVVVAIKK